MTTSGLDYIVVVSTEEDYHASYHAFAEKVNRKLKAGYRLHGGPFPVKQSICQAMVRFDDASGGNDSSLTFNSTGIKPV